MASPEQPVELLFPTNGLDVTTEYELQQPGTGPVAENVRSIDPITQRSRGASRAGCTRYVDDIPGGTAGLIQHLNVIVDPTVDALEAQLEDFDYNGDPNGIADPTNNPAGRPIRNRGRYIRRRGSGRTQRRGVGTKVLPTAVADSASADIGGAAVTIDVLANDTYVGSPSLSIITKPQYGTAVVVGRGTSSTIRYTPPTDTSLDITDETFRYRLRATGNARNYSNLLNTRDVATVTVNLTPTTVAFVQQKSNVTVAGTTCAVTFTAQPANNNLLVAFVATYTADVTVTVKNAAAANYTHAGSYLVYNPFAPANYAKLSVWYKVASDGASETTVNVTATGSVGIDVGCLEYSGLNHTSPFEGFISNSEATLFPSAWSTGIIPVSGDHRCVVGAFITTNTNETGNFTFDAATQRIARPDGPGDGTDISLWVGDITDESLAAAMTATDLGGNHFGAVGVSFKK